MSPTVTPLPHTQPHPAPIVRARPAGADETPRTAASLVKKATAAGWWSSTTYAKGTSTDAQGLPTKVVETVVVRLRLDAAGLARAAAIWTDGKFDVAFRWALWLPTEMVGTRELGRWVGSLGSITRTSSAADEVA